MPKALTAEEGSLYRAIWRWHFFAGLLVLPFLLVLATTGALYLFKDELDAAIYRAWDLRADPGAAVLPLQQSIDSAAGQTGGRVMQVQVSDGAHNLRMTVHTQEMSKTVFVDPSSGRVVGSTHFGGAMQIVRKIHSLKYFGTWASWLIEIAAGWAIVLVGTGFYLWWPRGRSGGVVTIRGSARSRTFWRDLHAVTGAFAGVVILFLAVTGMPWSAVWGDNVQEMTTGRGLGRPEAPAEVVPDWQLENVMADPDAGSPAHHGHPGEPAGSVGSGLPWALEKATPPQSQSASGVSIGADGAAAALERVQMQKPYSLTLPQGPRGAYAATYSPDRIEDVRVVYIDQYSGAVLDDVGYARFGPAAKAIEWGIAVHQGQEYGSINRYAMLGGCLAIVALAISSLTMWLKRRRRGTLGVPPPPVRRSSLWVVAAFVIPIGILYPLVGASLALAYVLSLVIARIRAMRPGERL